MKTELEEALAKARWSKHYRFEDLKIYYLHRGAACNYEIIRGFEIRTYNKSYIVKMDGTVIPTHRVFLIEYEKEILYKNERKFPAGFNLHDEDRREE